MDSKGLDLRCGGGRLGLQGAPGALPSALGFESLAFSDETAEERRPWRLSSVLVDSKGLDLRCDGGRLGLQGAPGALPSALGFESLAFSDETAEERRLWRLSSVLVDSKGLEPLTFRTSSGSSTS